MTPLAAFQADIASLFAEYRSGEIDYSGAVIKFSERSDLLLQAFLVETPPEVIDAVFQQFSELRLMGVERGDLPSEAALSVINEQALSFYPEPQERFAHTDPIQAELLFRIPSPEAA